MGENQQEFEKMEKKIYAFAQEIFLKNKAVNDLLVIQEQKEILHLKMSEVEKLQEVRATVKDFCEPQVNIILQVSQYPDEMKKADFNLVKNQAHQLVQNFDNLGKIIKYVEAIDKKQGKKLSKNWVEIKQSLSDLNVSDIKNIEVEASNLG
ncbi:hypothetical protein [Lactobacillus sp.]|uniref:hypothetical protein n=1 Tax=Lactobacillus sp. TaxID=1591 RepID=UPI00199FEEA3|nr:hypothetical protein [Lactobacillus sp.]MBD5430424.1 hypothetical protein [Lactobacillus sp.]